MTESVDLNNLTIKTDSLPDNWKMLLIDPVTGQPAQSINVARFGELIISKLPTVTAESVGVVSPLMLESFMASLGRISDCDKLGQYSAAITGGQKGTPDGIEGVIVILSFTGGIAPAYYIQFAIGLNESYLGMRRHIDTKWTFWQKISYDTLSYSLSPNNLTVPVSGSSLLPPRKLRAKLFEISQFSQAICESGYTGYRHPGWFNSS